MSVPLVSPYGQCLHFLGYLTWNGTLHFSRTTKEKSIKSRFRNLPAVLSYFIEDCGQYAMRYCLWGCFFLLWRTKNRNNFTGFLVFSIVFLLLGKKCPCKRLGNQAETESVCLWLFKKGRGGCYFGGETDQSGQGRSRTFSSERQGKTASYQTNSKTVATFTDQCDPNLILFFWYTW